jgi:predicted phosphodiesterase
VSMTIALIADIHGNLTALEAVLDALRVEPTGEIVCRGDGPATT